MKISESNKDKVLEALKLAVSIIERDGKGEESEQTTVGQLDTGDYAIYENQPYGDPMGVLIVGRGFAPTHEEYGYAVNLSNGIGCFSKSRTVRKVTREEAFAAAEKWKK